jgi:SAM-dependent MidA family methyltransferase
MEEALYGPAGVYRDPAGPAAHFRTSVHASALFARALARLVAETDAALAHPGAFELVDVGAGTGELLTGLADALPTELRRRTRLTGVEVRPRPAGLARDIAWRSEPPARVVGMVLANELLDVVPLDVAVVTESGLRLVEVHTGSGAERLGGPPARRDAEWLRRWWPVEGGRPGDRVEVGRARDERWGALVATVTHGLALAVDYSHQRGDRAAGRWAAGTLTGYRRGRVVRAVPDGSCDVTAHVALDACAAAGVRAGATETRLLDQRSALRSLGVRGDRPALSRAGSEPRAYLRDLVTASQAAELTAAGDLGGFGWLVQAVGMPLPASLA